MRAHYSGYVYKRPGKEVRLNILERAITEQAAKEQGFKPLTVGYEIPRETKRIESVLADLGRSNIETAVIQRPDGLVEVWRKGMTQRRNSHAKE